MMKLWNWVNGHKTQIAVVLTVVLSVLGRRGIEVPPWVFDITDGILGLGLAHKAVKVLPKKAAATVAALIVAALSVSCTTSPQSAPQIPLAPVYQAGSPVALTIIFKSDAAKTTTERTGSDARGDVGASGEQDSTPTTDVKPTTDISVPLVK